jgi:predicted ATPase
MIRKVSIRNFKSCRDVQIDLERFTIFVGPNASGKSSILQGLDLLCRSFQSEPDELETEVREGLSREANDEVDLACESGGRWYRYRTGLPSQTRWIQIDDSWKGRGRAVALDLNSGDWKQWMPSSRPTARELAEQTERTESETSPPLPYSVLLRLEVPKLIQASPISDPTVMAPDGSGLHSTLANLALNDPDSWQQLQSNLRLIIPTIRRLRHTTTITYQPPALLFDTVGADSLPAHQISEGTLLVLGLLTALHSSAGRKLVLLDDLDRGLHPKAQKDLISFLRKLLETNPDLQLLATTHSPYMLDSMEPSEVRMTFLREDRATVCAALAEHPEFEKWKDEMTPGELWSLFGEKWLVEQEASR